MCLFIVGEMPALPLPGGLHIQIEDHLGVVVLTCCSTRRGSCGDIFFDAWINSIPGDPSRLNRLDEIFLCWLISTARTRQGLAPDKLRFWNRTQVKILCGRPLLVAFIHS